MKVSPLWKGNWEEEEEGEEGEEQSTGYETKWFIFPQVEGGELWLISFLFNYFNLSLHLMLRRAVLSPRTSSYNSKSRCKGKKKPKKKTTPIRFVDLSAPSFVFRQTGLMSA